jgi:hypothetical protein
MKLSTIFLLLAFTAAAQTPLADVKLKTHQTNAGPLTTIDSVGKVWKNVKDVNPTHGMTYTYTLGDDTARYFHPVPGKTYKAKVVFYDAAIGLPTEPTPPPPPTVVQTQVDGERATFSTGWSHGNTTATGWFQNTIAYSNVANSTVTYTFTGFKVELWAEKLPNHGTGFIRIDNGPEVPVSFQNPTKLLPAKIYESETLTEGQHTITLRVGVGYNLLDYFMVYAHR